MENKLRIERLTTEFSDQDWDAIFIASKINQFYFSGTMQNGLLVLQKNHPPAFFVRRGIERAEMECAFVDLFPMVSYKDVASIIGSDFRRVYIEGEVMTCAMLERLKKYFPAAQFLPADAAINRVRAIKSGTELSLMEESGRQHKHLMEQVLPGIMREGMSETDFMAEMYEKMIKLGYHGVSRFASHQTEMVVGQIGFGDNSLYPTNFDGPGGMKGMCPAVPIVGDRERFLKKGDLVFVDVGYGYKGYHTDRTQVYSFGVKPDPHVAAVHEKCMDIEKKAADMLRPNALPSKIYASIINSLDLEFQNNFMGFGTRTAKFLGHGVGLHIDEYPVIAKGFDQPLEENMTIALEPKKGIKGVGMVGVEDTYVVTSDGGKCLTGGGREIIVV